MQQLLLSGQDDIKLVRTQDRALAQHHFPIPRKHSETTKGNPPMLRINRSGFSASAAFLALSYSICNFAQQPKQYSTEDYASAERFMAYNVNPLAYQGVVHAQSLEDGRF